MRSLLIAAALLCATGCSGKRVDSSASATPQATLVTPTPAVPWGRFVALDFQKPGQPKLTAAQVALIRKTLAVVKPCQQSLLRYSFDNGDPSGKMIDLYFEPTDDPTASSVHVLWQGDLYYRFEEGSAFAEPFDGQSTPDWSIAKDIRDTPCG